MKNRQKRNLWTAYGIAIAGAMMSLAPQMMKTDMENGGGAITLLGIFIAMSSWLVGILIFKEKARVAEDAMDEDKVIVKWVYDSSTWRRKVAEEKQDMRTASFGIMILALVLGTVIFIPMIIILEEKLAVAAIYGAVLLLCGGGIALNYNRLKYVEDKAYVVITEDGAVINGEVECWRGRGRDFMSAEYDSDMQGIVINYKSYYTKGDLNKTVIIPVPDYIEFDRENVVDAINMEKRE